MNTLMQHQKIAILSFFITITVITGLMSVNEGLKDVIPLIILGAMMCLTVIGVFIRLNKP